MLSFCGCGVFVDCGRQIEGRLRGTSGRGLGYVVGYVDCYGNVVGDIEVRSSD